MSDYCRKVSRGQVWFIVEKVPYGTNGDSLQSGSRPWLIVSNNACNQASPILTAVPLTTAEKTDLPTHVCFHYAGKPQTVLCEQIRSLPVKLLEHATYSFTLSEKAMQEVDEALAIQLGISLTFPNSQRFWDSIERLVRAKVKAAIDETKMTSIDTLKIVSQIDRITEELNGTKPEQKPEPTEEPELIEESEQKPKTWVPIKKPQRRKWSTQDMINFIADCDKLPLQDVSEKYGLKMASIYAQKSKFRRMLGETNGREKQNV